MGIADPNQINVVTSYSTNIDKPDLDQGALGMSIFPNPFSQNATIQLSLGAATYVTLDMFNIDGRRVRRLLSQSIPSGETRIDWDGRTGAGLPVPAGVYVARLDAAGRHAHRKVIRISTN